jgi:hypothetical protein
MGEGIDSGVKKTDLLYNEYIVYNVNQVRIPPLFLDLYSLFTFLL